MKKTFTQCTSTRSTRRQYSHCTGQSLGPTRMTLEIIRQFARTYQSAPLARAASLPGYSLN